MDGQTEYDHAGRALRDHLRDGELGIERITRIDAFEKFRGLLHEADQLLADLVRKGAGADRRERHHLKAVRQHAAVTLRAAVLDVIVDRMVIARKHLERREMRLGDGAAWRAEGFANFQVVEGALFRYVKRLWIEARHAATLAIAVVDDMLEHDPEKWTAV